MKTIEKALFIFSLCSLVFVLTVVLWPMPFVEEENYYQKQEGYIIDKSWKWSDFQQLDGDFIKVSRRVLREKAAEVKAELGFVRIFIDEEAKVIWISGIGADPTKRYIYWWSPR